MCSIVLVKKYKTLIFNNEQIIPSYDVHTQNHLRYPWFGHYKSISPF